MGQKKIKAQRRQQKLTNEVFNKNIEKSDVRGIGQILIENWKFLAILLLSVFVVYFNSLWGDFVSDDYASITQNPEIGNLFSTKGNTAVLLNWLAYVLFGHGSPVPYHVLSLIVYLLSIVLVFLFIEKVFNDNFLSKIVTVLFSVLPVHVEAVSWISGRIYVVLAIYIVFGLLMFIRYLETRNFKFLWPLLVAFVLAFLTDKPRPISLLFLMMLCLYYLKDKYSLKLDMGKSISVLSGVGLVIFLIILPAIKNRIGSVNFGYRGDGGMFYNPFFQYPTGIAKYLQLMWMPMGLTLYHTMYVFPSWLNWVILLVFISIMVVGFFNDKRYFFSCMFFLLTLAPSMAPVKVSWLVAERYIFLASLGFCLLIGLFLKKGLENKKIISMTLFASLVLAYIGLTFVRNRDWRTNHDLWVATVQVSQNSHNAWNNIGDDYDKLGQYENAIKGFTESTVWKKNYADAYHNRANIYFKTGHFELARDSYLQALYHNPGLVQTYISLVQVELTVGNIEGALEVANKAVEIAPNDYLVRFIRAVVLKEAGMISEAKKEAKMALMLNPDYDMAKQFFNQL